ncbi:MAG: protein kinase family protein [Verrucomicrobiota bacterium]
MIPSLNLPGYTLDFRIGRGAFGTVYRARWEENYPCAVKVLEGGALHRPYLGTVLEKLRELPEHPGLLGVHAFDLAGAVPYVSMALLPENAATFDELPGRVTEEEAWGLLRQLSDTLAWMHGHGIVHAGVTGGNVYVVDDGKGIPHTVLADAGQAWLGDGAMERLHDQAPCVPPERWRDPGRVLKDGHAETWDVYAFGVLAWRLLTGEWPRATRLFETVLASRSEGLSIDPPAFAEWLTREPVPDWPTRGIHEWEKPCRAMVRRCLETDPENRPESMMEVAVALRKCPALRVPLGTAPPSSVASRKPSGPVAGSGFGARDGRDRKDRMDERDRRAEVERFEAERRVVKPEAAFPIPVPAAPPPVPAAMREIPPAAAAPAVIAPVASPSAASPQMAAPSGASALPSPSASAPRAARGWPVEAMAAVLMVGAAVYAFSLKNAGDRSRAELGKAGEAAREAEKRAANSAAQAVILKKRMEEQRIREMAALRDSSAVTVGKMLESTPSDPGERVAWQAAAAPVADQLKKALAACDEVPALTASSMDARWQLANLYSALGKPDSALPLLEQLTRDFQAVTPADAAQEDQWRLLKARTMARRGAMLEDQRKTMEAVPLLREASVIFEQWLAQHPGRQDVARDFAGNSLLEGQALRDRNQTDDAALALARVAILLPKPDAADFLPEDTFLLGDSMAALAGISETRGQLQQSIGQRTQLLQLLLAYDATHQKSVPCRTRLTEAFLSLGQTLAVFGAPKDAIHAFQQAVKMLSELTTESPGNVGYSLQLARAYDEVAQLIQTANPTPAGAREAMEYGQGSVTILRRLCEARPQDNTLRLRLASALVLEGELRAAAGDAPEALLPLLQESVTLAGDLSGEATLEDAQRRECRKLIARSWSVIGGMQERTGQKAEAVASFNKALDAWSGFGTSDPAAQRMVAATRERLKKLQPGG